jgi:hypothetical protein
LEKFGSHLFGRSHVVMQKDNRKAPDADVTLSDGLVKRLSEFWKMQKIVLVFMPTARFRGKNPCFVL